MKVQYDWITVWYKWIIVHNNWIRELSICLQLVHAIIELESVLIEY